jgi:hypothetical protein
MVSIAHAFPTSFLRSKITKLIFFQLFYNKLSNFMLNLCMFTCCALRYVPMNPKLLEFFTYYPSLPLKNIFFKFLSTALRKLTTNYKDLEIFSIEKRVKMWSPVFLLIQRLVRRLVRGFSNVLFWLHCVVKQKNWEASYEASYEALNE